MTCVVSVRCGEDVVLFVERHVLRVVFVDFFVGEEYGIYICSVICECVFGMCVLFIFSTVTLM